MNSESPKRKYLKTKSNFQTIFLNPPAFKRRVVLTNFRSCSKSYKAVIIGLKSSKQAFITPNPKGDLSINNSVMLMHSVLF